MKSVDDPKCCEREEKKEHYELPKKIPAHTFRYVLLIVIIAFLLVVGGILMMKYNNVVDLLNTMKSQCINFETVLQNYYGG